jgi:threonyl-tRNA synthetase
MMRIFFALSIRQVSSNTYVAIVVLNTDHSQIGDEMSRVLDFIKYVYGLFGFTYNLRLSTRPEKYLGKVETWNEAEAKLKDALNAFSQSSGSAWQENPGDGAL